MSKTEKGQNIWVSKELIQSKAYQSLKAPAAFRVLALFWVRRQVTKLTHGKREQWCISNNGRIQFSYKEAHDRWHLSGGAFRRAIDELRDRGFVDVAETGQGVHKVANMYALSDRWRKYGTAEYIPPPPRKKGPINRGFQQGNRFGRNCQKKKSTVVSNNGSTVTDNNGQAKKW